MQHFAMGGRNRAPADRAVPGYMMARAASMRGAADAVAVFAAAVVRLASRRHLAAVSARCPHVHVHAAVLYAAQVAHGRNVSRVLRTQRVVEDVCRLSDELISLVDLRTTTA